MTSMGVFLLNQEILVSSFIYGPYVIISRFEKFLYVAVIW